MSGVVLIVEPDASGRKMMERILRAEGILTEAVSSIVAAEASLAASRITLALVDEAAGSGATLAEIRSLRAEHPRVGVVAMGTLLNERVLVELLRLGALDVLRKPFTPTELRAGVSRALAHTPPAHEESLEYSAAMETVRRCLARGELERAELALQRARTLSAFDSDVMMLSSIAAELRGEDSDANRGYRAALALSTGSDAAAVDAYAGLSRLEAYRATPHAKGLPSGRFDSLRVIRDPVRELGSISADERPSTAGEKRQAILLSIELDHEGAGVFFSRHAADVTYVLTTARLTPELIARTAAALGGASIVVSESAPSPTEESTSS